MARSRNIKPGFFASEQLGTCDHGARLLFAALWTLADREGRLEDRPMRIRAYAFPYDAVTVDDIGRWLSQLENHNLISRYSNAGVEVICVDKFKAHQNPHVKELPSKLPGKPSASTGQAPDFQNSTCEKVPDKHQTNLHSSCEKTVLIPDSCILIPESSSPGFDLEAAFDELWDAYPAKGRTRKPMSQQYYVEAVATLPDDQQAAKHRAIIAPVLPGGKWAKSAQWAKGFVQGLPVYLNQTQWLESPEPEGVASMAGAYDHLPLGFTQAEKDKMARVERERAEDGLQ